MTKYRVLNNYEFLFLICLFTRQIHCGITRYSSWRNNLWRGSCFGGTKPRNRANMLILPPRSELQTFIGILIHEIFLLPRCSTIFEIKFWLPVLGSNLNFCFHETFSTLITYGRLEHWAVVKIFRFSWGHGNLFYYFHFSELIRWPTRPLAAEFLVDKLSMLSTRCEQRYLNVKYRSFSGIWNHQMDTWMGKNLDTPK